LLQSFYGDTIKSTLSSFLLDKTKELILKNGGKIIKDTHFFPGGKRFRFTEPNGNEFAAWSEL